MGFLVTMDISSLDNLSTQHADTCNNCLMFVFLLLCLVLFIIPTVSVNCYITLVLIVVNYSCHGKYIKLFIYHIHNWGDVILQCSHSEAFILEFLKHLIRIHSEDTVNLKIELQKALLSCFPSFYRPLKLWCIHVKYFHKLPVKQWNFVYGGQVFIPILLNL